MAAVRDDIYEQPEVLRRAAQSLPEAAVVLAPYAEGWGSGRFERVIFTGMGGSFAALFPTMLKLVAHGVSAFAIESSELLYAYRPLLTGRTLVVAVSQSGESIEVARLFDLVDGAAQVIGVTNSADSTLARRSGATLLIGAGDEASVATKTYTATLATLEFVAAALTGESLPALAGALQTTADYIASALPAWDAKAQDLAAAVESSRFLIFVGRGAHRASALNGALVVKETAKVPTEGMVTGQFRHGPIEVLAEGVTPFIFMGAGQAHELHQTLARDLSAKGSRVVTIGVPTEHDGSIGVTPPDMALLPIAEIIPIQLFAAALATRWGIVPGTFYHSSKVTTVE